MECEPSTGRRAAPDALTPVRASPTDGPCHAPPWCACSSCSTILAISLIFVPFPVLASNVGAGAGARLEVLARGGHRVRPVPQRNPGRARAGIATFVDGRKGERLRRPPECLAGAGFLRVAGRGTSLALREAEPRRRGWEGADGWP